MSIRASRVSRCAFILAIAAELTGSATSFACDKTAHKTAPAVVTVAQPIAVTPAKPCEHEMQRLAKLQNRVSNFVADCRSDLQKQQVLVDQCIEAVAESQHQQAEAIKRLVFLRNLLDTPAAVIRVQGVAATKEQVAEVLTLKLAAYEALEAEHDKRQAELAGARAQLKAVQERVQKWQRQQRELIGRVDKLRSQHAASAQAASAKQALEDALKLADQLDAQFEASSPSAVATEPSTEQTRDSVSQAAEQFDQIFAKQSEPTGAR